MNFNFGKKISMSAPLKSQSSETNLKTERGETEQQYLFLGAMSVVIILQILKSIQ